jgi:PhnB protein
MGSAKQVDERVLRAGATSIEAPRNAPYGDRAAGVKDAFGNSWFIARYLGK